MNKRIFETEDAFINKARKYMEYCENKEILPNIAGFAVYSDMHLDSYYAQKEYYPEAFKKVEAILEDSIINGKANDTMKIFYMKNKFGYKDKQEIDNKVKVNYESTLKEMIDEDEY